MEKPTIRFKGYTEDWEQRKLGDNIVEYTEKTTENNQYPVLTSSRKGIFFQTDYYDGNQIASADNTGYNIVPYGYFTYRHMSDDEIFHFNINDIAENGIVSTLYPVFTTDENLDSRYLQYQLNYGREFSRYAILQKQGGSRTYMYLNKLRNLYLTVPTAIEEQKKISEYFTNLDHLITLHQRKCEETKILKKYMLQKMFPQNGQKVPEIRFKGFTEDWEQRKLGDSCKINGRIGFRGYTEKDIVTKEAGGVLTFSPTNIVDNKLTMECKNTYITREKYDESPEIKISNGDILFVKTGSTLGKSALVTGLKEDASINPQIVVMRVEKNTETFMSNILITNGVMKQVAAVKIGGAVPTMTETELKNFTYFAPAEKEEKKKIGDFFRTLDHLITLHQRKYEELKNIKKFMLQNMFV